jgi:hypothetical protein
MEGKKHRGFNKGRSLRVIYHEDGALELEKEGKGRIGMACLVTSK